MDSLARNSHFIAVWCRPGCHGIVAVNSSALQSVEWCNPSTSCYGFCCSIAIIASGDGRPMVQWSNGVCVCVCLRACLRVYVHGCACAYMLERACVRVLGGGGEGVQAVNICNGVYAQYSMNGFISLSCAESNHGMWALYPTWLTSCDP